MGLAWSVNREVSLGRELSAGSCARRHLSAKRAKSRSIFGTLDTTFEMPIPWVGKGDNEVNPSKFNGIHEARALAGTMTLQTLVKRTLGAIADIVSCMMQGRFEMDDVDHGRPLRWDRSTCWNGVKQRTAESGLEEATACVRCARRRPPGRRLRRYVLKESRTAPSKRAARFQLRSTAAMWH